VMAIAMWFTSVANHRGPLKRTNSWKEEEVRIGCAPRRRDPRTSKSPIGRCPNFRREADPKRKHVPKIGSDCFEIARIG
jgi:hypothetical protein